MNPDSIAFGPVPSRRLGRSLGINNIQPKVCDYSCPYCQIGATLTMETDRREFLPPDRIIAEVEQRVRKLRRGGEFLDYLSFVPDGEPTLDINLGDEIDRLRPLGVDIAVITNSSLLDRADVRGDLALADWVSLKCDSVNRDLWRRANVPHRTLDLERITEGARQFAQEYSGTLTTETMLVRDLNDSQRSLTETAEFLSTLSPHVAYLSIPTRPPAHRWVEAPDEVTLARAFAIFRQALPRVEYLVGYEGNAFSSTGNVRHDILSITAVHPMREEAIDELISRTGRDWAAVQSLLDEGLLASAEFQGNRYYLRKLR